MPRPIRSSSNFAILLFISAFALRLVRLDYQALWWDEGRNIFFAGMDWVTASEVSVRSGDVNPPIYRLLLGFWMDLAGSSPFVVRLPSVFFGMLAVVLLYRLATELYGDRVGVIAGVLATVAPPLVYYSQEAKGYPLVVLGSVCSAWMWLRLHRLTRGAGPWLLFGIASLLASGAHYFALLFVFVQNLWTVVWWREYHVTERDGLIRWHLVKWVGVQILALAPLLIYAWSSMLALMGSSGWLFFGVPVPVLPGLTDVARWGATTAAHWSNPGLRILNFLRMLVHEIAAGPDASPIVASCAGFVLATLIVLGWPYSAVKRFPRVNWVLWLIAPLILSALFSLRFSYFFPRFLIFILPCVLLLAAVGMETLWRRSRAALMPLVLILFGLWTAVLIVHYTKPSDPSEDWRGLAQRFARLQRRGDLAIHSYDWIQGYLHSYLPAYAEPAYLYFSGASLTELEQLTTLHSRVWFLDYQTTPYAVGNMAGEWMREHYGLAVSEAFGNAQMTLFARPPKGNGVAESAQFVNGIGLSWQVLDTQAIPGDVLAIELIWHAPGTPVDAYQIFLHMQDHEGRLWAGRDNGPMNDLRPTVSWRAGESVRSVHALLVPKELAIGEYQMRAGMYSQQSGVRLLTSLGMDSVLLGSVTVSSR